MANEKAKPKVGSRHEDARPPSHYKEQHIVVAVPDGTPLEVIEKQIHNALVEQPPDIIIRNRSKELVIVLQHEGNKNLPPQGSETKSKPPS
jgi:hypothetical protein